MEIHRKLNKLYLLYLMLLHSSQSEFMKLDPTLQSFLKQLLAVLKISKPA